MTSAHFLYIPIVFSLGLLMGTLLSTRSGPNNKSSNQAKHHHTVKGKLLFGSFLIFILVFIGTHFFNIPRSSKAVTVALNGAAIFDKKPVFSSEEVYARIASYPVDGIKLYQEFTYTIDILFPITLLVFLLLLSNFVTEQLLLPRLIQISLALMPIFWFTSDIIENSIIYYLLDTLPEKHSKLAGILGYLTTIKFVLLFLSIIIPTLLKVFEKNLSTKKIEE